MQHEIIRQICAAIQSANSILRIPTKIFLGPLATSHQRFVYFNIATQHPISHPLRLSSGESRGKEWFTLTLTSMNDVQSSISRKCMPLEYGWSCYTWKNPKHALGVYTPTPHPTFGGFVGHQCQYVVLPMQYLSNSNNGFEHKRRKRLVSFECWTWLQWAVWKWLWRHSYSLLQHDSERLCLWKPFMHRSLGRCQTWVLSPTNPSFTGSHYCQLAQVSQP